METIDKIVKRDGRLVPFDRRKIENAIARAARAASTTDADAARELSLKIERNLGRAFDGRAPSVEEIQNFVERELVRAGLAATAKVYILYRAQRSRDRAAKHYLGVEDDLKLSVNAITVLNRRYLLKDEHGEVRENPRQLFERAARAVAAVETDYGGSAARAEEDFFQLMADRLFMPNSPTLMNAGTDIGQLAACFVLPVDDGIEAIFDTLKHMALIHKTGGGTGFSFSRIRPANDIVKTTTGVASGPVSFMKIFDTATDVIKQGGRRRGANMGVLRVDHPDILDFITAKEAEPALANFNISVAVTDDFMDALDNDRDYRLVNPRTGRPSKEVRAKTVFDLIVTMAWRTGDPGLIFIDEINRRHPLAALGPIESTNPCGELPLLPYESCNLGSINLARFVREGKLNWERLAQTVHLAVRFLDNVIDAGRFPLEQVDKVTKANRKIGLGVMGFAEMLIEMGQPYLSAETLSLSERIGAFIEAEALKESAALAGRRGSFPNFAKSSWERAGVPRLRNATLTTVAPTGTISIIAGTSSGIEPLFAVSFIREALDGARLLEINSLFEKLAEERGFYSDDLFGRIAKAGSIQDMADVPSDIRPLFQTAFDIPGDWHVRVQAAWQKHVDNAVSKTVNLPEEAGVEDVRRIYLLAHKLRCKGITVYRYGSKSGQVLSLSGETKGERALIRAKAEFGGDCAAGECAY